MKRTALSIMLALGMACSANVPMIDAGDAVDAGHQNADMHHPTRDMTLASDMQPPLVDMFTAADMTSVYTVTCSVPFECCDLQILTKEAWMMTCRAFRSCPLILTYGQQCGSGRYSGWLSATFTCGTC